MARLSNVKVEVPGSTAINLTRLLARLQQNLITPDPETDSRLRASQFEREKVATNLEYARELLIKLEQDAQFIKVQTKKQETQADLSNKRGLIIRLHERLDELNELGENEADKADDSEGEDLLGEDTPSEDTQSQASHAEPTSISSSPIEATPPLPIPTYPAPIPDPPHPQPATTQPDPASSLRARHKAERAELLTPAATATATAIATSTSISTSSTEALLTHHRTEQEDLTKSLLSMAKALKESSHAFGSSLESEKDTLNNAAKSLDKSELGMEAAQRRMGYLRTMTEGRGWWGRMMMYAWIAGLMVVAILIVFVLPKLRF